MVLTETLKGVTMQNNHTQPNVLLTPDDTANLMQVSTGTLQVWRSTGRHGLPFVKVGNCVRYRLSDIEAWLADRTQSAGVTQ